MNLRDALQRLPKHEPRPDLWARIEADLRADALIDQTLSQLPDAEPKADSWENLLERLEPDPAHELRKMRPLYGSAWLKAAAVVAVAGGIGLFLYKRPAETIRISYETQSVEESPPLAGSMAESLADQKAERFIDQQCEMQIAVCRKPEVAELKQELADLNVQKARVEEQLQVFGNDAVLVQAQIKIENGRAEVMKELVRVLTL